MTTGGPLDDHRLRRVQDLLDADDVDAAQATLATIPDRADLRDGVDYLTARLLYRKQRLRREEVALRLQELLARRTLFPEAARFLAALGGGAPLGDSAPAAQSPRPGGMPAIPRSPGLPTIEGSQAAPSYAPAAPSEPPVAAASPRNLHPTMRGIPSRASERAPGSAPPGAMFPASDPIVTPRPPSLSPPRAAGHGRYSEHPPAVDSVGTRPPPGPRSAPSDQPRARPEARTAPSGGRVVPPSPSSQPAPIRSVVPPPVLGTPASPVDIAALIDAGRYEDALALTALAGQAGRPEVALLRARALARAGQDQEALELARRVAHAPLIEPEVRAGCARLLVELGDATAALDAARRAHRDEPRHAAVRFALAAALARAGLCAGDDALLAEAAGALDPSLSAAPHAQTTAMSIQALTQASLGDPEQALALAQRALGADSRSVEALAAAALSSARLRRIADAGRAWLRLVDADHRAADALAARLEACGVAVEAIVPERRASARPVAPSTWHPTEEALLAGNRTEALADLAALFAGRYHGITDPGTRDDPALLGKIAASMLQGAPVFRWFVPYDGSLASLRRLEAALDCLIGSSGRFPPGAPSHAWQLLLAAYTGECVRLVTDGRWVGGPPLTASRVAATSREWAPFRAISARATEGARDALAELRSSARAAAGAGGATKRVTNPVAPPWPWDPDPWPAPSDAPRLGRELARSIPALFCARRGTPLDGTLQSITGLDAYLELLAPPESSPDSDAAWARGVAALGGSYLGEVLRARLGGRWANTPATTGPESFEVELASGTLRPVAWVWDRLAGRIREPLASRVASLGTPDGSR